MTKQQQKIQGILSWVALMMSENHNPDVKGEPEGDTRPMFMMGDAGIYREIQSRLDNLRLSKVAHRLATELTTMVLVQSDAVSDSYEGIQDSSVYKVSA